MNPRPPKICVLVSLYQSVVDTLTPRYCVTPPAESLNEPRCIIGYVSHLKGRLPCASQPGRVIDVLNEDVVRFRRVGSSVN